MSRREQQGEARRRDRESGQAMVEFALILFPLLLIVAGVIQFGIGLHYWHDTNRIANQGARFAVVNSWPGCARDAPSCTVTTTTCPTTSAPVANQTLQNYLRCQAITNGLRSSVTPFVCYPDDGDPATDPGTAGTPVRVWLESDFTFVPIVELGTINLVGSATMRLEQTLTHITGVVACPT